MPAELMTTLASNKPGTVPACAAFWTAGSSLRAGRVGKRLTARIRVFKCLQSYLDVVLVSAAHKVMPAGADCQAGLEAAAV